MPGRAPRQNCPNCGRAHDVSVYVSGQRALCRCGLHFIVQRADVRRAASVAPRDAGPAPAPADASLPPFTVSRVTPATPNATRIVGEAEVRARAAECAATVVAPSLRIPGYELMELLGRGGMGEVWKARQLSLDRVVALKVLPGELAGDAAFVRRFAREAEALAALTHPNIVAILDRGVSGGADEPCYFAMEFCEGESLRERIEARRLNPGEALRVVARVARAVDYAHGRGVIHRDLKPENILVGSDGEPKVVDFGLAGLRGPGPVQHLTQVAMAMGTPHYMAPEQRRDARSVDERADVFALGVILYEALTSDLPVGNFRTPSQRVAAVDGRVDKIVLKALEADPAARYPSAGAMALELEALLEPGPDSPGEKSGGAGLHRWLRRVGL